MAVIDKCEEVEIEHRYNSAFGFDYAAECFKALLRHRRFDRDHVQSIEPKPIQIFLLSD